MSINNAGQPTAPPTGLRVFNRHVLAGQPLAAQLWNDLVDALDAVIQAVLGATTFGLRVTIQNADIDLATVRVTAVDQASMLAYEAVRPVPPDKDHVFASLKPGTYQVLAEAPGFAASNPASVTIHEAGQTLSLFFWSKAPALPALFGLKLRDALTALATAGITAVHVLDVTGKTESPTSPSPEAADAPVLAQLPPAGQPVPLGGAAQLVIAVVPKPPVMVQVPSLVGLTDTDARKLLAGMGLQLGTAVVAQPRTSPSETPISINSFQTDGITFND
jgi:hypothetical protein